MLILEVVYGYLLVFSQIHFKIRVPMCQLSSQSQLLGKKKNLNECKYFACIFCANIVFSLNMVAYLPQCLSSLGRLDFVSTDFIQIGQIMRIKQNISCRVLRAVVLQCSAQSCPTLCYSMHCRPPGSSVYGIVQARIREWVAISSSRGSSRPKDQIQVSCVSCISRWVLYNCAPGKPIMLPVVPKYVVFL